jgi:hypothetical protein
MRDLPIYGNTAPQRRWARRVGREERHATPRPFPCHPPLPRAFSPHPPPLHRHPRTPSSRNPPSPARNHPLGSLQMRGACLSAPPLPSGKAPEDPPRPLRFAPRLACCPAFFMPLLTPLPSPPSLPCVPPPPPPIPPSPPLLPAPPPLLPFCREVAQEAYAEAEAPPQKDAAAGQVSAQPPSNSPCDWAVGIGLVRCARIRPPCECACSPPPPSLLTPPPLPPPPPRRAPQDARKRDTRCSRRCLPAQWATIKTGR